MNSRDVIAQPGPAASQCAYSARGDARKLSVTLKAGMVLLDAVAQLMDAADCDSGMIVLDGAVLGPFNYVMPSYSNDDVHAAWYSATHACSLARLQHATATVGRRDGAWWMHCHARWDDKGSMGMGHLLPESVTIAQDATVTLLAFSGGTFDVALDPETAFPLFQANGGRSRGNALIAKVSPHADIFATIEELIRESGFSRAAIHGIGSLIGAQFDKGPPMESPISEVLIPPAAHWDGTLRLPMFCVDTRNIFFSGNLIKGGAAVLITFELMIIEQDERIV